MTKLAVFYSTGAGSTRESARIVAEAAGAACLPMEEGRGPEGFDAVILGAPIRFDRWLRPATAFARAHSEALARMPVAGFFACLAASDATGRGAPSVARYAERVAGLLPGVASGDVGCFAGVLDYRRLSWYLRPPLRLGMTLMRVAEADYRDPDAIARWGRATGARLRAEVTGVRDGAARGVAA